jgi:hypothetical protein
MPGPSVIDVQHETLSVGRSPIADDPQCRPARRMIPSNRDIRMTSAEALDPRRLRSLQAAVRDEIERRIPDARGAGRAPQRSTR